MKHKDLLTALQDYYGGDNVVIRIGRKLAEIRGISTDGGDIVINAEWIVKEKDAPLPDSRTELLHDGGEWICVYTLGDTPRYQRFRTQEQAEDYNMVAYHGLAQVLSIELAKRRLPDLFR